MSKESIRKLHTKNEAKPLKWAASPERIVADHGDAHHAVFLDGVQFVSPRASHAGGFEDVRNSVHA